MYDDDARGEIISNLESRIVNIIQTAAALAEQGYLINKRKHTKLDWSSILIHAFENIDVLKCEQKRNIEKLYANLSAI